MNSLLILSVAIFLSSTTRAVFAFPAGLPNPWDSFRNLSSCHLGDHNPAITDLKAYLTQFGYLAASANFSDDFDDVLESALLTYQHNFGLNATGSLDLPTIEQLVAPRCGVADIINGTSSMASNNHGRNLYAYFQGEPSWPSSRRSLTYAFTSTSASKIDVATLRTVFARAFAHWAAVTTLTFAEADGNPSDADISIGFYSGAHGDGEPFDGPLGTLAHAFSPTDGRFHLDAAEEWVAGDVTTSGSDMAVDLESVAVHEIGHLLGLGHSSAAEAIMYPTIKTRTKKVELARDDVDGIQGLYGRNPAYKGVSPAATSTTNQESDTNDGGFRTVGSGSDRGVGRLLAVMVGAFLVF